MDDESSVFEQQYGNQAEVVALLLAEAERRLQELDTQVEALALQCNFESYDEGCQRTMKTMAELLDSEHMGDSNGPYRAFHLPEIICATEVGII
ncbi:MAG: hypothetical protein QXR28_04905 [Nitrososphaerota archaeon]